MRHIHLFISLITLALLSCGHPSVPQNARQVGSMPAIYPDYTEVTVPSNICPMNFMAADGAEEIVARLTAGEVSYCYGEDNKVFIDEDEWAELRDAAVGKQITVEVFARYNGEWKAYKPFAIYVAKEEIDPYISYRLIQPSYVAYEGLSIAQRDITSFTQTDIYNNRMVQKDNDGQCINCHSYQNYSTENMLFHMRQYMGGTMIVHDGKIEKVNLKTDSTISAGVYPAWHPTEKLIAFSTNKTTQSFHTKNKNKIEVFDTESDIILYDVEKHTVSSISNRKDEFEVFPTWSPDGKTLYYCSAHYEYPNDSIDKQLEIVLHHREVKYSIYARTFDSATRTFGPERMVFDAAAQGKSATLPRVSPDGKYLVFSLGDFGCFHVWHNEADIYCLPLDKENAEPYALRGINSGKSESYPSFSSNGRWVMAASRKDDGNYTRPVMAYFGTDGQCRKAFMLPQADPEFYTLFLRSFNRPEFMKEPVKVTPQQFARKAMEDAVNATYK